METSQLKKHIVNLVEESANGKILEVVYAILEQDFQREKPVWDTLGSDDKRAIDNALSQSEQGRGIPHGQVVSKFKARYGYPK